MRHTSAVLVLCCCLLPAAASAGTGPTCDVGTVTRAGALNYDAKILKHNRVKGLYLVEYVTGYKGDQEWLPATALKTCTGEPPPEVKQDFFLGTWALWTGGGGAYVKKGNDWHATWTDVAKAPPLTIRKDGTYAWTIDSRKTVQGKWHVAQTNELKYGYDKRGLTLLLEKGEDGADWLVSRDLAYSTRGDDAVLIERRDLGLTFRGYKK
jgi:hypothetical protein